MTPSLPLQKGPAMHSHPPRPQPDWYQDASFWCHPADLPPRPARLPGGLLGNGWRSPARSATAEARSKPWTTWACASKNPGQTEKAIEFHLQHLEADRLLPAAPAATSATNAAEGRRANGWPVDPRRFLWPPGVSLMSRIFISHTTADRPTFVDAFIERLRSPLSRHLVLAAQHPARLLGTGHPRRPRRMPLVPGGSTPNALQSDLVRTEVALALADRRYFDPDRGICRVVPVLAAPCDSTTLHPQLHRCQLVNFTSRSDEMLRQVWSTCWRPGAWC